MDLGLSTPTGSIRAEPPQRLDGPQAVVGLKEALNARDALGDRREHQRAV